MIVLSVISLFTANKKSKEKSSKCPDFIFATRIIQLILNVFNYQLKIEHVKTSINSCRILYNGITEFSLSFILNSRVWSKQQQTLVST